MSHDVILHEKDYYRLNVLLTKLIDKSRIEVAALINKSGRLLTSQSESGEIDITSLGALVVGSFVSTTQIANLLGESEFSSMYHQGVKNHLRVVMIDHNTLLTAIFDNRTTVDKVKKHCEDMQEDLKKALANLYEHIESNPDINIDVGQGDSPLASREYEMNPTNIPVSPPNK